MGEASSVPQTIAARARLSLGHYVISSRAFLKLEKGALLTDESDSARVDSGQQAQSLSHSQMLLTGATSGLAARFFTHPMDTVKTRLQVQGALQAQGGAAALTGPAYASTSDAVSKILRAEGIRGFYRGFGAVVTAVPMASAVYFWGYEFTKEAIGPSVGSTAGIVLGGMCAQAAAGLIYTPMDVIKERQQVQTMTRVAGSGLAATPLTSSLALFSAIVKRDGPVGLFRGYWTSNLAWWPWNIIYFVTYEQLKAGAASAFDTRPGDAPPPMASAGCATVAATVATTATAPIDVVKTRLQALPREIIGAEGGAFSVAATLLRQEGTRAIWSGTLARVLSIAPGAAISFFAFETLKERWTRL